ncbi:hypothetical protein QR680_017688 [Steinernema hermaphroditum]|uniref:Uncharacterized protein n=1 Tax=Steinernema hermaphroditum TaxID=289476 RepID=A0AA39LP42_9BILA|nr:hypothetical protein QR680_017688 [Steinernema hermaphroditum]
MGDGRRPDASLPAGPASWHAPRPHPLHNRRLRLYLRHFRAASKEGKVSEDWSYRNFCVTLYVAVVIDRLMPIIFTFVDFVGTVLIITQSPMLHDYRPDDHWVSRSLHRRHFQIRNVMAAIFVTATPPLQRRATKMDRSLAILQNPTQFSMSFLVSFRRKCHPDPPIERKEEEDGTIRS